MPLSRLYISFNKRMKNWPTLWGIQDVNSVHQWLSATQWFPIIIIITPVVFRAFPKLWVVTQKRVTKLCQVGLHSFSGNIFFHLFVSSKINVTNSGTTTLICQFLKGFCKS